MDGHQRDLPIAQAEQSREAYAEAVRGCGLGPTAEAIALWLVADGRKELLDGDRVMTAGLPSQRELARRVGRSASSVCCGLAMLERAGLLIRSAGRIVLNLIRVCELANARATERMAAVGFPRGWRPRTQPAESEPHRSGDPPRSAALGRARARSAAPRSEKQETINNPESLTETEKDSGGVERSERDRAQLRPADLNERMGLLNRSAAWQALQAADFVDAEGRRTTPPVAKLWAAFGAAAAIGLVADDLDHELRWFATVHDCAAHARSPAGALAWRTASGKLSWAGNESWTWAKRLLASPPADDEPIAAMASSCKLSDELIAAMAAARDLPGDPP